MKELSDIIAAYEKLSEHHIQMALATVVAVEGSSYRRPGARMLISETGQLTGAISGGCLEGDALRKALLVIRKQQNKLVTYDTRDEDDATFGISLGCNGIIHVLIEPIIVSDPDNPVRLLQKALQTRQNAVIITFFNTNSPSAASAGTCLLLNASGEITGKGNMDFYADVLSDAKNALEQQKSILKTNIHGEEGLSAMYEFLQPPVSIHIVGAGNDVQPVVELAAVLGWETFVYDGRLTHARKERFPNARQVICCKAEQISHLVTSDVRTFLLLMAHNYDYEFNVLKQVLKVNLPYIGILGPKKKTLHLIEDIRKSGQMLTEEQVGRIFGPVGIDIGAEAAEEIALSVIAEIKTVLSGRKGYFLKEKSGGIHDTN